MFDRDTSYPTAVASYDTDGVKAALDWCCELMEDGDTLTVWTHLKSNLENSHVLESFVNRYSDVRHVTGRGGGYLRGRGPVLMAWADMDDIGKLVQFSGSHIRGLCVITWAPDRIRPWVTATNPTILGDGSDWEEATPELDPVVVEAMKSMTLVINHNNTISAGFEKDQVVGTLLALHKARFRLDPDAMQGWALAHGWSGKNPQRLADYVKDINAGKRPRARLVGADYIDHLRERAANPSSGE